MKKGCELCKKEARVYCESDEARLCFTCDEKVHCANFLVAKHFRSLLCHVCEIPTPWKASGPKLLAPSISVCQNCFSMKEERGEEEEKDESIEFRASETNDDQSDGDDYSSYSDSDYDDDDDDDEDDDDGENQVVPWSCCNSSETSPLSSSSSPHQPPFASSSSSEENNINGGRHLHDGAMAVSSANLKRLRGNNTAPLDSDDEDGCSSKLNNNGGLLVECDDHHQMPSSSSSNYFRPIKIARTRDLIEKIEEERRGGDIN